MEFKYSVAMIVTEEQFNKDLKQPLLEMGFKNETWGNWNEYNTLLTVKKFEKLGNYYNPNNSIDIDIDYYNPQLFLALAAMTNNEKGNIGEYWYYFGEKAALFKKGELYKQVGSDINNLFALLDDNNTQNGFCGKNLQNFRKATVEEIMKKFNYINKNICFKSDGTKETGLKIILELEKLGGINESKYDGSSNGRYYFINNKGNLDIEWGIPEGYELISLNKEKIMKNRILTPANATKIINVACSTWKPKLAEKWATNIVLNKDTEISEEFYQEMRKACTADQNELFDLIFGKDEQLISPNDLAIGEAMKICDGGSYNGIIISRIWSEDNPRYVNVNNTSSTWKGYPDFKGKKVKLTITHEEVK